jgi:hypothetical protein
MLSQRGREGGAIDDWVIMVLLDKLFEIRPATAATRPLHWRGFVGPDPQAHQGGSSLFVISHLVMGLRTSKMRFLSSPGNDASHLWSSHHQHVAPIDLNHYVVSCNMTGNYPLEARGR